MVFELSYVFAPLVGGVIGYITNDIAIRMLFRPHTPKYIFGMKIPFTPGIIPKEKGRIATAIGGAISENLMNREVLEKNLLSEEMIMKIKSSIDNFFEEQKNNTESVKEFMQHFLTPYDVDRLLNNVKNNLNEQVVDKLKNSSIGDKIAEVVVQHVSQKLKVEGLPLNIPQMLKGLIGSTIWGQLANLIETPAKKYLSQNINQMLEDNGQEIVGNLIDNSIKDFSQLSVQELLRGKDAQIVEFTDSLIGIYRMIILEHLPKILGAIDIPHIIEARINEMDMDETEKLIFQVMDKELKAIVRLGALLGLIMGCVNIFI